MPRYLTDDQEWSPHFNPYHPQVGDMIFATPAVTAEGDLLIACNGWLYRLGN